MPNLVTAALRGWRSLLAAGLMSTIVSAYGCNISGFECGVLGSDGQVRTCSRPGEVCVCETHSCAVRKPEIMADNCTSAGGDTTGGDTSTGGSTSGGTMMCATGLVYVADYVADPTLAGKCVERCSELASVIDQVAMPVAACEIMPPPMLTGTSTGTPTTDNPTMGTTDTTGTSETSIGTTTSGTSTSDTTTGDTTTSGTTTSGSTTSDSTTSGTSTGDTTTSGTTTN